eukprot:Gb_35865 [translate_table: standard]
MASAGRMIGAMHLCRRGFTEGREKVLSEEEKAAESIYIKKMEQEKLEKLAHKGFKPEEQQSGSTSRSHSTPIPRGVSTDTTKNIAVLSGVIAVVSGILWYVRSSSEKPEQHD